MTLLGRIFGGSGSLKRLTAEQLRELRVLEDRLVTLSSFEKLEEKDVDAYERKISEYSAAGYDTKNPKSIAEGYRLKTKKQEERRMRR